MGPGGRPPFSEWGKLTDGERTPWVEWYDIEKLKLRLHPGRFETVLEFASTRIISFGWTSYMLGQLLAADLPRRVAVAPPTEPITTPPSHWHHAWSMPLDNVNLGQAITAEIICSVETGTIGLAFERNSQHVSREVFAEALTGTQLLYVTTSAFGPGVSLTARNGSALGASRLTMNSISLRPMQ